jgi:hypothetical protein
MGSFSEKPVDGVVAMLDAGVEKGNVEGISSSSLGNRAGIGRSPRLGLSSQDALGSWEGWAE